MIQILQVTVYQLISVAAIYHAEQFTDDYGRRDLAYEWRAYRPTGELSQAALIDAGSFQRLISRQIGPDFLTNFFYAPDVVRLSRVGKNVRAKSEVIPDSVFKPNPRKSGIFKRTARGVRLALFYIGGDMLNYIIC